MGSAGNVVVDFVADMERFSPQVKDAPKQVRDSAAKINTELDKIGGGEKGGLRGLASMFGRGSELGLLAKTMLGGGALMAVGLFAREVENLVNKFSDLIVASRDSALSVGEWTKAIGKEVPIVGGLATSISDFISATRGKMVSGDEKRIADTYKSLAGLGGTLDEKRRLAGKSGLALAIEKENTAYEGQVAVLNAASLQALKLRKLKDANAQAEAGNIQNLVKLVGHQVEAEHKAAPARIRGAAIAAITEPLDKEYHALIFTRDALLAESLAQAGASQEDIRAALVKRQLADATKTAAERATEAAAAIEKEDEAQRKHVATMLSALGKEAGEYGMTGRQKQLREIFFSGAGFYEKAAGMGAIGWMAAQDKAAKAMERAKAITESMRTPAEKYADTLRELNELLAQNADFQEAYTRAVAAARKELEGEGRAAAGAIGGFEGVADTWKRIAGAGMRETSKLEYVAREETAKRQLQTQEKMLTALEKFTVAAVTLGP
jgi:hypothetical protein